MPVSTKFEMRNDPGVVRNYGRLLVELSAVVPDGEVMDGWCRMTPLLFTAPSNQCSPSHLLTLLLCFIGVGRVHMST